MLIMASKMSKILLILLNNPYFLKIKNRVEIVI